VGKKRDTARRLSKLNKYIKQEKISIRNLLYRVLNGGPEMVGVYLLTREEAYNLLWQDIFDWLRRENVSCRYRDPGQTIKQKTFNHIPKPIPKEYRKY
jgi:hypothetical protein